MEAPYPSSFPPAGGRPPMGAPYPSSFPATSGCPPMASLFLSTGGRPPLGPPPSFPLQVVDHPAFPIISYRWLPSRSTLLHSFYKESVHLLLPLHLSPPPPLPG